MTWNQIEGHDKIAADFARAFARHRLEGSYLFTGRTGIGKRSFAFALAKTLLCRNIAPLEFGGDENFDLSRFVPCGECESCRMFDAQNAESPDNGDLAPKKKKKRAVAISERFTIPTHPDFYFVNRPPDRAFIPLELLIGAKDERMRAGLCFELSRTPYFEGRKIAVIDDADFLNPEGANALLKTLEEPPPKSVLILIGTSAARQLPTIRSRCRTVRFSPLEPMPLVNLLLREKIVETPEEGLARAKVSSGSLTEARLYDDNALLEFRGELFRQLNGNSAVSFARRLNAFVDSAGKEAPARRKRLAAILTWSAEYYRDLARALTGAPLTGSAAMTLRQTVAAWPADTEAALRCADRTLLAMEQIDKNANLPVIAESWLYDLEKIIRR